MQWRDTPVHTCGNCGTTLDSEGNPVSPFAERHEDVEAFVAYTGSIYEGNTGSIEEYYFWVSELKASILLDLAQELEEQYKRLPAWNNADKRCLSSFLSILNNKAKNQ